MSQKISLKNLLERPLDSAFENFISARFVKNMEFFRNYNPPLFERLKMPPNDFNLHLKNNELNIINLKNGEFVYPKNMMIKTALNLSKNPLQNPAYKLFTNNLGLSQMDEKKLPKTGRACNKMNKILTTKFSPNPNFHLPSKFLPNLTIFGIFDGIFLEILRESGYFFHALFIFEGELDFFRISLYFVDFEKLFSSVSPNSCYIFVEKITNKNLLFSYFFNKKISNNFLRLELQLYESEKLESARDFLRECYAINSRGWGSFEDEMIGVKNTFSNINFGVDSTLPYPILSGFEKVNAPICVVGNGASLDGLLPFIKKNKNNMIIFSSGTAIRTLMSAKITPDFQIEIERLDYLSDILGKSDLSKIALLCGNMVNPKVLKLKAKNALIFMRGGGASAYTFKPKFTLEFASPFVGNASVALAALFSHEVLLCGLDCGFVKGHTKHAKNSFYTNEKAEIPPNAFKVKANSNKEVFSDAIFATSVKSAENALKLYRPNLALNLGFGAKIEGAKFVETSDFELRKIDKKIEIKKIKNCFSAESNLVFLERKNKDYFKSIETYKDEFFALLDAKITNKKELFSWLDLVSNFISKFSQNSPFIGVLFEGSLAHMAHYLMICSLHIPRDDISNFFRDSANIIKETFLSFVNEFYKNFKGKI